MNVNGSRFHLLIGEADWGRCLASQDGAAGSWMTLSKAWAKSDASPPAASGEGRDAALDWDEPAQQLRLKSLPIALGATPGDAPLTADMRRSVAADRNGNIYWIDNDPSRLRVRSAGTERESTFWPDGPVDCSDRHRRPGSDFSPIATEGLAAREFTALVVTEDHYLVVAFSAADASGLMTFDLMAGGPPVDTLWPAPVDFAPFDMAQRKGGGAWVLDRANRKLWELDRRLQVIDRGQAERVLAPAETEVFRPVHGNARQSTAATFPEGIDLATTVTGSPISVEALADGSLLDSRSQRRNGDIAHRSAHAPSGSVQNERRRRTRLSGA